MSQRLRERLFKSLYPETTIRFIRSGCGIGLAWFPIECVGGTVAVESINKVSLWQGRTVQRCNNVMIDTWLTLHNGRGHLCQGKKNSFDWENRNNKRKWNCWRSLIKRLSWPSDCLCLEVCSFFFVLISCTDVDPLLFELCCLGPSVSMTSLSSYLGKVLWNTFSRTIWAWLL